MRFSVTDINYNYKENQGAESVPLNHKYCNRSDFENTIEITTNHNIIYQDDDNYLYYIFFTFR